MQKAFRKMAVVNTRLLMVVMVCLFTDYAGGQMLGTPFVDAYSKTIYGYGTQNWDIEQAENGTLYFANNDGLLEFDGARWNLYPLPNRTIMRSILIHEGSIYAGGQNEFGRFELDPQKKWAFRSLVHLIPEPHQDFEDVWDMQLLDGTIYFRASEKIFLIRGESCKVITEIPIQFLGKAGGRIFVQHRGGRLYVLNNDVPQAVAGSDIFDGAEIRKVAAVPEGILIATRKQGLFLYTGDQITAWENQGAGLFPDQFINTLAILPNQDIVLGTGFRGVVMMDRTGKFKYQVRAEDGLSNNRVICTFVDRQHNLWLGLDNGISMIRTSSPFSRIYPDGDLEGAGYDVALLEDKIYFGTSSGLFFSTLTDESFTNEFKLVENSSGQVWGLDIIDGRLILNHNEGAFLVSDDKASRFFSETGVWLFRTDQSREQIIISGNYKGIDIFDRSTLQQQYHLSGLNESSRFIVQDEAGSYWMAHPYRGIYKIDAPHDPERRSVRLMGPDHGLPSNLHNHVFEINGEILICAETGVFTFDEKQQQFQHYEPIERHLGTDTKIRRLFESPEGDVWFVTEKEIGVLEIEETGLERTITKRTFPELKKLMNGGWEMIRPYGKENVFIGTINGFLHYRGEQGNDSTPAFEVLLQELRINKDSTLIPRGLSEDLILRHYENSLLFHVAATEFVNNSGVRFQYLLEGFDDGWSLPTESRSKEFTKLSPGDYVLHVKGINQNGEESALFSYPFEIEKPWYATYLAILFYLTLAGFIVYLLVLRSRRKFKALEQKVDSTVKKSKEEIQRLETEKVHAELEHKKRELVSATLHLVKKNETMAKIADQISEIKRSSGDPKVSQRLQKLVHFLKQDEFMDEGWEQVMYHFNELNVGYFERLKKQYPKLTPKDLKLCAYLNMNLTTKEMAALMNVSLRGVEASRYRLRKKLELDTEDNLTEFLMSF